ncbi:MAG: hypothetical protein HGB21_03655 [Nitrospirae bacterium]|nr:hypothetical protein [Nitrospirota bacterium]NTW65400.1 hypothetical protein [Nitrospirota bacterium]
MKAVANDVSEGYMTINPLVLKKFDKDMIKDLFEHLNKAMAAARNLAAPFNDVPALRQKNMKLQRLHNAIVILRNFARERRIPI